MNLRLFTSILLLFIFTTLWAQPEWENPEVVGINKLPYHSTLQLPSREADCSEIVSLDGQWYFNWVKEPALRPVDFYRTDYDVGQWSRITVPGNWQMQGWDIPIYTNMTYPFARRQPSVSAAPPTDWYAFDHRNPVGSYVTFFDMTKADLADHNIILHFGGVKSAMYVWINGQRVGYSQNSMSPAEFDITPFVRLGSNRLAVEVYRWSDGSYLEDQDMWRLSGIFRPVQLWIRPLVHISDYFVTSLPSADFSQADVTATVQLCNVGRKSVRDMQLRFTIDGQTHTQPVALLAASDTATYTFNYRMSHTHLWSAHDPFLYPFTLSLLDRKGREVEHFVNHTGVKRVEVVGEVLKINGKNVKLRGVNRHDHHPRTGRYVNRATYELDIALMKQCNINFLRTSHYPDDPYLYELCDRYGIFVMDEANQESHGYGIGNTELGNNPSWLTAHVDRARSLVQRDKNHPSVTFWSLGNEGGRGSNMQAMRRAVLAIDSTRPVFLDSDRSVSDIYDDSYLPPLTLAAEARRIADRPFMMREYVHAMGNSVGGLTDYMQVIYSDSSICGAAVWDWVDQGIARAVDGVPFRPHHADSNPSQLTLREGEYWAYGGDFGDRPNDGNFCLNGLIAADRTPHPHYYEVRHAYQPIRFVRSADGQIRPVSVDPFVSVDDFDYTYTHGESSTINAEAHLKTDTPWAPRGFVVAYDQFEVTPYNYPTTIEPDGQLSIVKSQSSILVKGIDGFSAEFDTTNGAMTSLMHHGEQCLAAPLEPHFWKPVNDNQRAARFTTEFAPWHDAASRRKVESVDVKQDGGLVSIVFRMTLPVAASYTLSYTINAGGQILVAADYQPSASTPPFMPKFGMRVGLPIAYDTVSWLGRGPHENYPDRKLSQLVGSYAMPLSLFMTDYARPQDNGNRCDVRWFSLASPSSIFHVSGCQPLCFRAWDYDESALDAEPRHPFELQRGHHVTLNIDLNIHGVGGIDTWGAKTLPQYCVPANRPLHYAFIIHNL